jgi:hypothetical protein
VRDGATSHDSRRLLAVTNLSCFASGLLTHTGTSVKAFGVWTHAVAFREMRIAQILAFVQKAKQVLSFDDVLHTLINRKCG